MMTWDDINIEKWLKIQAIVNEENQITRDIKIISIINEVDEDEIRSLTIPQLREQQDRLQFISGGIPNRIETIIEIKGVKYGIIPQLDFITAGEWNDCENLRKDPINNLPYYMAILYRPVTLFRESDGYYEIEKYSTKGFNERVELFKKEMPCTIAYSTLLFFSSFVNGLMPSLETYLTILSQPIQMKKKRIQKSMKKKVTTTKKKTHIKSNKTSQKSF